MDGSEDSERLPDIGHLMECYQEFNEAESVTCLTDALMLADPLQVGIDITVGDADFWPNGGTQ